MIRIASGVVLIALVVATVWYAPPWVMVSVAALLAAIAATELAGISRKLGAAISPAFLAASAAVVCVALAVGRMNSQPMALTLVLLALIVAAGAVTLSAGAPDSMTVQRAAVAFMAPLYIGLPFGAMAAIRATDGPRAFMVLFVLLAVSDSAQYYTGRAFGRRKLAPAVSPAKTVEGAIGGFVGAAIVGAWLGTIWIPGVQPHIGALLGLVLAGVGMMGDLFESLLKRGAGVKDSSSLIPGHGGVLDRVDSYLFAAPIYFVFLEVLPLMKRLAILGSTGSIGRSALAVVDARPEYLRVTTLAAGENTALVAEQIAKYQPAVAAVASESALADLRGRVTGSASDVVKLSCGREGLLAAATHPDVDLVLCATAGTAALEAVLAAIDAGKAIALANKEVLVMAGALMMDASRRRGVEILPVDSEHNAVHQCLHGRRRRDVRRIVLTASGGPFRTMSAADLAYVTPADALRHPTWQMGRKITVDSATLMNKGLEVIEAHWLFGMASNEIDVVVHPQSIVHSLVELRDGSMIAQLGVTDMRLPIQYAFAYPDRWDSPLPYLDLTAVGPLEFGAPDLERFRCLRLAYWSLERGGAWPIVLNAANEVAVEAFLAGRVSFLKIPFVIERALEAADRETSDPSTLDDVRHADGWARAFSSETIRTLPSS